MIFRSAVVPFEDAVDSIRDMPFENLYEIVAKHTWPEKAEVPGARCDIRYAENGLQFCGWKVAPAFS